MSSNKTRFPGMDNGNSSGNFQTDSTQSTNPYSHTTAPGAQKHPGTVFPGGPQGTAPADHQSVKRPSKPVFGFLYSISNNGWTEFWPLQLGENTIGSTPECDVFLPEATVSHTHASLQIRKMKNPQKVEAWITDSRSMNGSMVNGMSVGIQPVPCKNGDIITIGENYVMYLVLLDTDEIGLAPAQDFKPISVASTAAKAPAPDDVPSFDPKKTNPDGMNKHFQNPQFDPSGSQATFHNPGSRPTDGTVGLDGTLPGNNSGGTSFME